MSVTFAKVKDGMMMSLLALGVIALFQNNNTLTRIEERVQSIDKRVSRIEKWQDRQGQDHGK